MFFLSKTQCFGCFVGRLHMQTFSSYQVHQLKKLSFEHQTYRVPDLPCTDIKGHRLPYQQAELENNRRIIE